MPLLILPLVRSQVCFVWHLVWDSGCMDRRSPMDEGHVLFQCALPTL